jgi:HAD superfamily hydrolase (TIGR01509 family)
MKAFIFDFDGVIVSSEGPRFTSIKTLLVEHGIEVDESERKNILGRTTLSFLERIIPNDPALVTNIIKEFRTRFVQHITDYVEPIDMMVQFIRDYDGKAPLAIASMSSREAITAVTKHLGIYDKIAYIITRDEVQHHKPHPEIYLKTADILGVTPKDCLVFEDTVVGVQAALAASMTCCVVLNGSNDKTAFDGLSVKAFVSDSNDVVNIAKDFQSDNN